MRNGCVKGELSYGINENFDVIAKVTQMTEEKLYKNTSKIYEIGFLIEIEKDKTQLFGMITRIFGNVYLDISAKNTICRVHTDIRRGITPASRMHLKNN